jgi:hypothetical protein
MNSSHTFIFLNVIHLILNINKNQNVVGLNLGQLQYYFCLNLKYERLLLCHTQQLLRFLFTQGN